MIEGGSAGGLLMGAVVNMRPDLFKAVHLAVPFVDVVNDMFDPSLPLTTTDYPEWGNPTNDKAVYDYILSYSPYDNIHQAAYPAMLLTESLNDSQVAYWEAAKFVARARTLKTDNSPILLKMKMDPARHGGASGRYDQIRDRLRMRLAAQPGRHYQIASSVTQMKWTNKDPWVWQRVVVT